MDKKIKALIEKYSDNEALLIQLVVTAFARFNHLELGNGYLSAFVDAENDELEADIELLAAQCTIENVISLFELAIPDAEKTANGAVYTPKYIRDYIVRQVMHSVEKPLAECLCADISCGCGAFLYTLAEYIHEHTGEQYSNIFAHLYGVDISATNVNRAKIMLALVALQNGEIIQEDVFNLFTGDSLTFDFRTMPNVANNNGLDIIVGNPPYVRSKHIDKETKKNLPLWSTWLHYCKYILQKCKRTYFTKLFCR